MSSVHSKASAVQYGEREITDPINVPIKTSAGGRHEAYEMQKIDQDGGVLSAAEEDEDVFGSVPTDQRDMHRMGKEQEMKRVFRQFSLLSFGAVLMATWEYLVLASNQGLIDGGRAGLFWSYVWTFFGYGFQIISLAEMASMAPTAGGQYHWVSEFAPPQYQKFLSYFTGWLSTLSWQAGNATGGFLLAYLIQSLMVMKDPSYGMPNWQTTILCWPMMILPLVCNIWLSDLLPSMQNIIMILHLLGFLVIVIVLWVLGPHVSATEALLTFSNDGGWSSMGLALMIGQISSAQALGTSDAAAHMSEEVRDAGLTVPKAMIWTYCLNGMIGFIMLITYIFSMPSVDDAVNDVTGFPIIYVLNQALPVEGTMVIVVLIMVLLMAGNISYQASTARQVFAFARDNALPYSSWIGKINTRLMIPVNAVIVSTSIAVLLSLINFGSSVAFNAIISLATVAQMAAYLVSISCVLYRRITAPHLLPKARWSLGRWGILINGLAIADAALVFFWACWPIATPVDVESFNWAPIVFVLVFIAAGTTYVVKGRKVYVGPVAYVEGHRDRFPEA